MFSSFGGWPPFPGRGSIFKLDLIGDSRGHAYLEGETSEMEETSRSIGSCHTLGSFGGETGLVDSRGEPATAIHIFRLSATFQITDVLMFYQ